jgi:cysteine desulfuration protein SufE
MPRPQETATAAGAPGTGAMTESDGARATAAAPGLPGAADMPVPLARVVADLECLDRAARIEQLIAWADEFAEVPPGVAVRPFPEASRVPHCESGVHVFAVDRPGGTLAFHFAVESPHGLSAKAWAVILARTCGGQPLEQVAGVSPDVIFRIFGQDLSMGKGQGLIGMLDLVMHAARTRLASRRSVR